MTIRNLESSLHPKSVAVIGASDREGSVGRVVMSNIISGGFEGEIWPVNPKRREIAGRPCCSRIADMPGVPDLAVVVTPPPTVPRIIHELGVKGTRVAVVITAGVNEQSGLKQAMLDAAKPFLFRIIGPNSVGLVAPWAKLNASFAHMTVKPGGVALLSQSGAIATSLIDWAADKKIGFSHIVSMGDMADVDVADLLDLLAGDANTRAIVMYLESIPRPRKFMSAARAAARLKPVVAIKPGRHAEAAKAAATHTGALSGADRVVEAALNRAGVLRVRGLADLFDATETIARFAPLERARVGIVTNGGGAGVLAVDQLMDSKADLAELSLDTIARLDKVLPPTWSRANPADIIGDASPERYTAAIEAVAADPQVDALLVMNCPTGLASPAEAAQAVASLAARGMIGGKPVLTSWLGEHTARAGRAILEGAGIATYETPSDAARAVSYLSDWSRAQRALMRVPSTRSEDIAGDRDEVLSIFRKVASEGRSLLTEPEAKAVIAAYGIPVPETVVAHSPQEAEAAAERMLRQTPKVVVKLLSRSVTHKSDVGGVVLGIETAEAARNAAETIQERVARRGLDDAIDGFSVQPMIERSHAQELILGVSQDAIFGPVVLFGAGGTAVEVIDDTAIALPPLDDVLASDLIERTRIGRLLAGYRDRKPADRHAISLAINALSQLVVDFPCIFSMDINPLLADDEGVLALDARVEIEPSDIDSLGPNPALAIRPYPDSWQKSVSLKGEDYFIRPIKPADIALYPDFFARISPEDIRLRFLAPRKQFSDKTLLRLTQLDYDREMAFLALEPNGDVAGIVRIYADPDHETGEYAILVRSDLHGHGVGWALLQHLIDYATADGLKRIEGIILAENTKMLEMCREMGFTVRLHPTEHGVVIAARKLN
ncbi:acetyltransferase [Mesorhizobium soli]|uniref:bifunctional acetate--CoA ligase family protein/GNAT family N-acetyltransferase n=1 Tax=Pseudaminobacter soli (ex Li et al. 2025) TaxID=1295366 RepID=UPI0024742F0D|nr:bifunctional acetate--CoA ligase family protein/GNAT family N-acetyltransferase [Mesorhizobium soli]MDH6230237.1 acetyltransferase [Mesorhizobium soli]